MFTMATMKGMSPEEAKRQAAVMWDSMGEEKREEWKQKARAERAREKGILANPSDSNSSRKLATTEASPKISRSELMKRSLDSEPDKRDITFIVADVLIWCDAPNKGKTLPAEISLTKFSLNQGVISTMNWLVPALEIPQGYHWDMRKASEEGHKLPIDDYFKLGYENPEERVQRIVTDILNFIGNHSTVKRRYAAEYMSSNVEPVIYAMPEKEEIVEKSLNYIIGKVGVHKKDARFFVCPLDELLYEICLSSKFGKEAGGATSKQVAHIQLQKDTRYIWMDGLKCEFHSALPEGRDVTNEQCARALSMTHAFRFLAVGCIAHQVDMKPGRHLHVVEGSDSSAAVSHDWPAQTNGFESSWTKGAGALDPDTSTMTETDDMEDLNKRFGHFALEE